MERNEANPSPLERRGRYPREGERAPEKRPLPPPVDPLVPHPEKVDPATQGPVGEIPESDWEGQEGVGPGPRDAVRKEEKGDRSPEEPPEDNPEEGGRP
jgi:hypothetical protein